jgi:3-hydroxyisobutyrate dehydrogenase
MAEQGQAEQPDFYFCEQSEKNADAFLADIRKTGGEELARRVRRVGSGKE